MSRKFWQFKNQAGAAPELLLYGDIADSTWWGDEATPKQFKEDLDALGTVEAITVRINSGGGDVFAAQAIGNMLEQHGAQVTARLDGLCASAATIVACHCDRVEAARDSTYMVHPVRMCLYGYYDAVEMGKYLAALDTIKKNIISLYAKKTGAQRGRGDGLDGRDQLVDRGGGPGARLCGPGAGGRGGGHGGEPGRHSVCQQRGHPHAI